MLKKHEEKEYGVDQVIVDLKKFKDEGYSNEFILNKIKEKYLNNANKTPKQKLGTSVIKDNSGDTMSNKSNLDISFSRIFSQKNNKTKNFLNASQFYQKTNKDKSENDVPKAKTNFKFKSIKINNKEVMSFTLDKCFVHIFPKYEGKQFSPLYYETNVNLSFDLFTIKSDNLDKQVLTVPDLRIDIAKRFSKNIQREKYALTIKVDISCSDLRICLDNCITELFFLFGIEEASVVGSTKINTYQSFFWFIFADEKLDQNYLFNREKLPNSYKNKIGKQVKVINKLFKQNINLEINKVTIDMFHKNIEMSFEFHGYSFHLFKNVLDSFQEFNMGIKQTNLNTYNRESSERQKVLNAEGLTLYGKKDGLEKATSVDLMTFSLVSDFPTFAKFIEFSTDRAIFYIKFKYVSIKRFARLRFSDDSNLTIQDKLKLELQNQNNFRLNIQNISLQFYFNFVSSLIFTADAITKNYGFKLKQTTDLITVYNIEVHNLEGKKVELMKMKEFKIIEKQVIFDSLGNKIINNSKENFESLIPKVAKYHKLMRFYFIDSILNIPNDLKNIIEYAQIITNTLKDIPKDFKALSQEEPEYFFIRDPKVENHFKINQLTINYVNSDVERCVQNLFHFVDSNKIKSVVNERDLVEELINRNRLYKNIATMNITKVKIIQGKYFHNGIEDRLAIISKICKIPFFKPLETLDKYFKSVITNRFSIWISSISLNICDFPQNMVDLTDLQFELNVLKFNFNYSQFFFLSKKSNKSNNEAKSSVVNDNFKRQYDIQSHNSMQLDGKRPRIRDIINQNKRMSLSERSIELPFDLDIEQLLRLADISTITFFDMNITASSLGIFLGINTMVALLNLINKLQNSFKTLNQVKKTSNTIKNVENMRFKIYIDASINIKNASIFLHTSKNFYEQNYINVR